MKILLIYPIIILCNMIFNNKKALVNTVFIKGITVFYLD